MLYFVNIVKYDFYRSSISGIFFLTHIIFVDKVTRYTEVIFEESLNTYVVQTDIIKKLKL